MYSSKAACAAHNPNALVSAFQEEPAAMTRFTSAVFRDQTRADVQAILPALEGALLAALLLDFADTRPRATLNDFYCCLARLNEEELERRVRTITTHDAQPYLTIVRAAGRPASLAELRAALVNGLGRALGLSSGPGTEAVPE